MQTIRNSNVSFESRAYTLTPKQSQRLDTSIRGILNDSISRKPGIVHTQNADGLRIAIPTVGSIGTISNWATVLQPVGLLKKGNKHIAYIDYHRKNGKAIYTLTKNDGNKTVVKDKELYTKTMAIIRAMKKALDKKS